MIDLENNVLSPQGVPFHSQMHFFFYSHSVCRIATKLDVVEVLVRHQKDRNRNERLSHHACWKSISAL